MNRNDPTGLADEDPNAVAQEMEDAFFWCAVHHTYWTDAGNWESSIAQYCGYGAKYGLLTKAFYVEHGGGGASNKANPKCPPKYQNFFDLMIPFATQLANKWNTNSNFILALSAYESGWDPVYSGPTHKKPINNPFGLTQAGKNDLTFESLQEATNFWSANDGKYIEGTKTIDDFAVKLQPHYNKENPNWTGDVIDVYSSVLKRRPNCDK